MLHLADLLPMEFAQIATNIIEIPIITRKYNRIYNFILIFWQSLISLKQLNSNDRS